MKIHVYGNNLNEGYNFSHLLNNKGVETRLFTLEYPFKQEFPEWWRDRSINEKLIRFIKPTEVDHSSIFSRFPLMLNRNIRKFYREISGCDLIFLSEDGPALMNGISRPTVFLSKGHDLQVNPFLRSDIKSILRGDIGKSLASYRQRRGIRRAKLVIAAPNQEEIVRKLKLRMVSFKFTIPMDTSSLVSYDEDLYRNICDKYKKYDLVLFHPTRQYYFAHRDWNKYLKDNDKLIEAYSRYCRYTKKNVILLLVRKGLKEDIEETERQIISFGIRDRIEWVPEMENYKIRTFYKLPNSIVCDQYSPYLAYLGNIGREASYYGKLIITAFNYDWNRRVYGEDMPKNVFPAISSGEIFDHLKTIEDLGPDALHDIREDTKGWFLRFYDGDTIINKYIDMFEKVLKGSYAEYISQDYQRNYG
jgi:hypothetical protein